MHIETRNLSVAFPVRGRWFRPTQEVITAVRDVSIAIEAKKTTVLLGPSGCGKTTLLWSIAGLQMPSNGAVLIDGRDVTHTAPKTRSMSLLSQSTPLWDHLTVLKNIQLWLVFSGIDVSGKVCTAVVREAAQKVGITHLLNKYPKELSGGERQRVGIAAKVLVPQVGAVLLDEPLTFLDEPLQKEIRVLLKELFSDLRQTILYVTHNQEEAAELADSIVVMDGGRVRQVGSYQELYQSPHDRFVAEFIGDMTSVPLGVLSQIGNVKGAKWCGIRPEHLSVQEVSRDNSAGILAQVESCRFFGSHFKVSLRLRSGETMEAHTASPLSGECLVAIDPAHLHVFDESGIRVQ